MIASGPIGDDYGAASGVMSSAMKAAQAKADAVTDAAVRAFLRSGPRGALFANPTDQQMADFLLRNPEEVMNAASTGNANALEIVDRTRQLYSAAISSAVAQNQAQADADQKTRAAGPQLYADNRTQEQRDADHAKTDVLLDPHATPESKEAAMMLLNNNGSLGGALLDGLISRAPVIAAGVAGYAMKGTGEGVNLPFSGASGSPTAAAQTIELVEGSVINAEEAVANSTYFNPQSAGQSSFQAPSVATADSSSTLSGVGSVSAESGSAGGAGIISSSSGISFDPASASPAAQSPGQSATTSDSMYADLAAQLDGSYARGEQLSKVLASSSASPTPPAGKFSGTEMVDVNSLVPMPGGKEVPDSDNMERLGAFDWERYQPINVFQRNGVNYLQNGMTRKALAERASIPQLPAKVTRPGE